MPHSASLPRLTRRGWSWACVMCYTSVVTATSPILLLLLLLLRAAVMLFCRCCCCCCSRSLPNGVGRPGVEYHDLRPRSPPGFPSSSDLRGVAPVVHDVLPRLIMPLFSFCSGAAAMHVLLMWCFADSLVISAISFS